jgi:lactoylglutathione lyase
MQEEAAAEDFNPAFWPWGKDAKQPRFLHTMIRVRDADASVRFYTEGLGMQLLDRFDFEGGRFSLIYLAFDGYEGGGALELTYNWDQAEPYSHGAGYGHVAIGVPDIETAVIRLEAVGAEISTRPKKMIPGSPFIAFAKDPDGYQVELIQTNRRT